MYTGVDVGELLRKARRSKGWSLYRLSEELGVSRSSLQRWENGSIKTIPGNMVKPISDILHIEPWKLLGYESIDEFTGGLNMNKYDMISRSAFSAYLHALSQEYSDDDFNFGKKFERDRIISVLRDFPSVTDTAILKAAKEIEERHE